MAERDEKDAIEETNTPPPGAASGAPSPIAPGAGAPSVPTPPAPAPVLPPPAPATPPQPSTPPPSAAPQQAVPTPTPPSPSAIPPAPETPPAEPGIQSDIARILATAQLPERREVQKGKAGGSNQKTYDTVLGQAIAPTPEEPRRVTPEAPAHKDALATVHTLRHDLQDVVRDQKISRVRAAAIETEKRRPEPIDDTPPKKTLSLGVVFALIALLFLGLVAIAGVYYFSLSRVARTPAQASDSLVFAEAVRTIPLDGRPASTIKQELADMRNAQGNVLGSIARIIPTYGSAAPNAQQGNERLATTRELFVAIGAQAPEELLRALSDTFFLGTHTVDENAPFIVIPVLSYDRAFAGMLAWEDTINADFAPFFTPLAPLIVGEGGVVVTRSFTDDVNRNYDVRVLKDDSGAIQLYYSFPTRGMLVIAESPYTLSEAVTRLQAARRL